MRTRLQTRDSDLPQLLGTLTKQVKWATKLIKEHLGCFLKRTDKAPLQGMFSRTFFASLTGGREVVVQFRTEPLDAGAFKPAKAVLRHLVPEVQALSNEELENAGAWAYALTRMPGQVWF